MSFSGVQGCLRAWGLPSNETQGQLTSSYLLLLELNGITGLVNRMLHEQPRAGSVVMWRGVEGTCNFHGRRPRIEAQPCRQLLRPGQIT